MIADVTFRGMEPSVAIENYIAKNLAKFKKYFGKDDSDSIFVHVILEGKLNHHIYNVEIRVKTPHVDLIANREGAEMYPLIDQVSKIMEHELEKEKQRIVDDMRKRKKAY